MQKAKQNKPRLGKNAQAKFDKAVEAIYDGIVNVSRLRLMDKRPKSMNKSDWDCMYVERAFALAAGAISTDIRTMTEVLAKQAQEDLEALQAASTGENKDITPQGNENTEIKEED